MLHWKYKEHEFAYFIAIIWSNSVAAAFGSHFEPPAQLFHAISKKGHKRASAALWHTAKQS